MFLICHLFLHSLSYRQPTTEAGKRVIRRTVVSSPPDSDEMEQSDEDESTHEATAGQPLGQFSKVSGMRNGLDSVVPSEEGKQQVGGSRQSIGSERRGSPLVNGRRTPQTNGGNWPDDDEIQRLIQEGKLLLAQDAERRRRAREMSELNKNGKQLPTALGRGRKKAVQQKEDKNASVAGKPANVLIKQESDRIVKERQQKSALQGERKDIASRSASHDEPKSSKKHIHNSRQHFRDWTVNDDDDKIRNESDEHARTVHLEEARSRNRRSEVMKGSQSRTPNDKRQNKQVNYSMNRVSREDKFLPTRQGYSDSLQHYDEFGNYFGLSDDNISQRDDLAEEQLNRENVYLSRDQQQNGYGRVLKQQDSDYFEINEHPYGRYSKWPPSRVKYPPRRRNENGYSSNHLELSDTEEEMHERHMRERERGQGLWPRNNRLVNAEYRSLRSSTPQNRSHERYRIPRQRLRYDDDEIDSELCSESTDSESEDDDNDDDNDGYSRSRSRSAGRPNWPQLSPQFGIPSAIYLSPHTPTLAPYAPMNNQVQAANVPGSPQYYQGQQGGQQASQLYYQSNLVACQPPMNNTVALPTANVNGNIVAGIPVILAPSGGQHMVPQTK